MEIVSVKRMKDKGFDGNGYVVRLRKNDEKNGIYWVYVVHVWKNSLRMMPFRTGIKLWANDWNKAKKTLRKCDGWQGYEREFIKKMNDCFEIFDKREEE